MEIDLEQMKKEAHEKECKGEQNTPCDFCKDTKKIKVICQCNEK